MMPVVWLKMITLLELSFSQVMLIWAGFSFTSLLIGIWFYPWHNLRVKPSCDTLNALKKDKQQLLTIGEDYPTLWTSLK